MLFISVFSDLSLGSLTFLFQLSPIASTGLKSLFSAYQLTVAFERVVELQKLFGL